MDFLLARAKGEIPTGAKFIREVIINNHFYKQDSKISPCLVSILTKQILKLHKDEEMCACECNTNGDSTEFKMEENKIDNRKLSQDITASDNIFDEQKIDIKQLNQDIALKN